MFALIAASKVKPALPAAGKHFVLPSLDQIIIKLVILYLVLIVMAGLLTFVFKSDPPSRISTITFWAIAFGSAVFIFSR
jgi:hypothetical protein